MLIKGIKISANASDDKECYYTIELSNGETSGFLKQMWGYTNDFEEFGFKLSAFPQSLEERVKFEAGNAGEKFACYLLLDVFCFDVHGYSAIHVLVNNNEKEPYTNKCEFYIRSVPASINKLGKMLRSFNPALEEELVWEAED